MLSFFVKKSENQPNFEFHIDKNGQKKVRKREKVTEKYRKFADCKVSDNFADTSKKVTDIDIDSWLKNVTNIDIDSP